MFLQCGYGTIGKKLYKEFEEVAKANNNEILVYDTDIKAFEHRNGQSVNYTTEFPTDHFNVAFICVPTPMKEDGSCDTSIVEDLCRSINADLIVIKSTVTVGTTDKILNTMLKHVVFSPEFTSATVHGGEHNYLILGGGKSDCLKVAQLYRKCKPADYEICMYDAKTAELSKYAANCFLAMKVTFFNEIAKAAKKADVDYEDVRSILIKDSRIGSSHTIVFPDQPYYDSHCFNKDIPAFINQFDLPLMKAVNEINNENKKQSR